MTATITLVTSNPNKVRAVLEHTEPFGVAVVSRDLPLVEPQADTVEAVALSKARQAFHLLHEPVMVEDGGFCIDELAGFPGPYTKYILETIGVAGLLNVALPLRARTCRFQSALVYIDERQQEHVFVDNGGVGTLSAEIDTTPSSEAWSDLWRIFIADDVTQPLTALSPEDRSMLFVKWQTNSVYTRFGKWFREQHSNQR